MPSRAREWEGPQHGHAPILTPAQTWHFFAGPRTVEELREFPKIVGQGDLMVVLTEGGKTPLLPAAELAAMGYALVGYSGLAIGSAAKAVFGQSRRAERFRKQHRSCQRRHAAQ